MDYSPSPKITKKQVKIENILITFDRGHERLVQEVFDTINKKYAAVHVFRQYSEEAIEECRKNILLSKRTIKFVFLFENRTQASSNISWDKWFHLGVSSEAGEQPNQTIQIKQDEKSDDLISKLSKKLHLNFVWLGIGCRLGTSVPDFLEAVKKYEPYEDFQSKFLHSFLTNLDKELADLEQSGDSEESYKDVKMIVLSYLEQMNDEIEDLVCHCYNERIAISGLTYHNFYKLLKTRITLSQSGLKKPTTTRYKYFKKIICEANLVNISRWMEKSMENFLLLDDYFYEKYQQRVSYEANFVLNKGLKKENYETIIQKNYEQIFRKFRPDFDQYFISICEILKVRAGCIKEAVGSVIVKNKRILSTGYNGTPINSINCYNGGCRVCNNSSKIHTIVLSCNCIHAEYSCIIQAGIQATPGCTLYTTQLPCLWCSKVIVQAMISTVVYVRTECEALRHENEQKIFEMFKNAGVVVKEYQSGQGRFSKN